MAATISPTMTRARLTVGLLLLVGVLRDAQVDVNKMFFPGGLILILCAVAVFLVKPQSCAIAK